DHVIDLDGLIVLTLAGERGEVEARGIEPIASSEVVGQRHVLYDALNLWVESETLRVARADIVSSDADAGQHVAVRIDRCAGDTRRKIAPALHVAEDALAGLGRVDSARGHRAGARAQRLNFEEKERAVLDDRSADAAAEDILLELRLAHVVHGVLPLVGVEARRAIEPKAVAVKLIAARARHHRDLSAGVAAILRGAVAGHQAKLGEHVGINAEGGGVRSALARVVDVDAVERVVPGAVARAVHVNAAAGVGAVDDAGLRI